MDADVQVLMRIPTSASADRLRKFLRNVEGKPSLQKLAKEGLAVDASVGELVKTFPRKDFWEAIGKLHSVDTYPPDERGVLYQLDFEAIDYPYATSFAEQIKTWLSAIGCSEIDVCVNRRFSQPTSDNILRVGGSYKCGKLAVFVGAGVSHEAGLPLWEELLNVLIEVYVEKFHPDPAFVISLRNRERTELARWLKRELANEFPECVRQALYRKAYRNGLGSSQIVHTIAKMKLLRAVCSYNYDDLLERESGANFQAVNSAKDWFSNVHTPVYHVHGLLPFVGSPEGELILSEADYHGLANNSLHWSNVVQVNLLRECTCLLIGISCTDPNLRRILDLVGSEKAGDTYIVQKMADVTRVAPDGIKAWSTSKEFDRDCFAEIHLRTIWIHDYDEIPDVLEACMGSD